MRDWREYWRNRTASGGADLMSELKEVGKTVLGHPISEVQLESIVSSVRTALRLQASDVIADLGCGNGLITARLAPLVQRINAFDISEPLIAAARARYRIAGLEFKVADVCELDFSANALRDVRKVFLYEVAQHLTVSEFEKLIVNTFDKNNVVALFSGSVPEFCKLDKFYDTPERMELYRRSVCENNEQIGTWWKRSDMEMIAERSGLKVEFFEQEPSLYTSHYRFDVLFRA
jgi:SAM-dependent methyltransferase